MYMYKQGNEHTRCTYMYKLYYQACDYITKHMYMYYYRESYSYTIVANLLSRAQTGHCDSVSSSKHVLNTKLIKQQAKHPRNLTSL